MSDDHEYDFEPEPPKGFESLEDFNSQMDVMEQDAEAAMAES